MDWMISLPPLATTELATPTGPVELTIAFLTLTVLEIVLGIDNVIFISILAGKLPRDQQAKARLVGLSLAMITRVLLLLSIAWMAGLTKPLFSVFSHAVSGRDLILLIGGIFLIWKSTHEIHQKLEGAGEEHGTARAAAGFTSIIIQIILLDIVFSLDSVITAVGMVNNLPIMIAAVIIAVIFMMFFSGPISGFVDRHPTVKMLALSFLLLIGVTLIADGCGQHVSKGYIYFAMGFSVFVEILNIKIRKLRSKPVELRGDGG
jgi:predicted tellurium resistance membrane protein TerC